MNSEDSNIGKNLTPDLALNKSVQNGSAKLEISQNGHAATTSELEDSSHNNEGSESCDKDPDDSFLRALETDIPLDKSEVSVSMYEMSYSPTENFVDPLDDPIGTEETTEDENVGRDPNPWFGGDARILKTIYEETDSDSFCNRGNESDTTFILTPDTPERATDSNKSVQNGSAKLEISQNGHAATTSELEDSSHNNEGSESCDKDPDDSFLRALETDIPLDKSEVSVSMYEMSYSPTENFVDPLDDPIGTEETTEDENVGRDPNPWFGGDARILKTIYEETDSDSFCNRGNESDTTFILTPDTPERATDSNKSVQNGSAKLEISQNGHAATTSELEDSSHNNEGSESCDKDPDDSFLRALETDIPLDKSEVSVSMYEMSYSPTENFVDPLDDPIGTEETTEDENVGRDPNPWFGGDARILKTIYEETDSDSFCNRGNESDTTLILTPELPEKATDSNGSGTTFILSPGPDNKQDSATESSAIVEINSESSEHSDCIVTSVEPSKRNPKKKKMRTIAQELRRSSRKREAVSEIIEDISEDDIEDDIILIHDQSFKQKAQYSRQSSTSSATSDHGKKVRKSPKPKAKTRQALHVNSSTSENELSIKSINSESVVSLKTLLPDNDKNDKNTPEQAVKCPTPEPILPTLAEDMFVIEAPSIVIPYVYEKPPAVPFKAFVKKLGDDIREQRAKEELEAMEKKLAEEAKQKQERQEKREKGEEVEQSDEKLTPEELQQQAAKTKKTERRLKKKLYDEDDKSWDGSSSEDSDDESLSGEDELRDIVGDVITQPNPKQPTDVQFESTLGKFFIDIGTKLVQEHVQTDLLNQQNKKLKRATKDGLSTTKIKSAISQLTKNLETTQKANASFKSELKKCSLCKFESESSLALEFHREMLHMRNNKYICRDCSTETVTASDMLMHMFTIHQVEGRVETPIASDPCPNCLFEDYGKAKLIRHSFACNNRFNPDTNLAPPADWEFPAKTKPVNSTLRQSTARGGGGVRPVCNPADVGRLRTRYPFGNARTSLAFQPRLPHLAPLDPRVLPRHRVTIRRLRPPHVVGANTAPDQSHSSMLNSPPPAEPIKHYNFDTPGAVIRCEICDGHVRHVEQLRQHLLLIHKHKIHHSVASGKSRPPMDCQRCHSRFFTEKGLERHFLGAHGLVTKSLQEAANMQQDGGHCPVCGIVFAHNMLEHVSRDHKVVLKTIDLSYKCMLCASIFDRYRKLEIHIHATHIPNQPGGKESDSKKAKLNDAAKN